MIQREECINEYFKAWVNNDVHAIHNLLSDNILYSECYGPVYQGITQVITWFLDWNQCGTVRRWDIKQFIHQKNITVVEWYFECLYNLDVAGFNGVSIIEFDLDGKISSIREFQSKAEHYYPYGEG